MRRTDFYISAAAVLLVAAAIAVGAVLAISRERHWTPTVEAGLASAPSPSPSPSASPAPETETAAASRPVRELRPVVVKPKVASATRSGRGTLGPSGWMWTKPGATKYADDLVLPGASTRDAPRVVRAPRLGQPQFVTTRTKAFVAYEEHFELGPEVYALSDRGAKLVGAVPAEWAFDLSGGRTLLVGTRGGKMMIASRWLASVLGPDGVRVVSSATGNESAWGAVAVGDGFVIAVREPIAMAGATLDQKVAAVQGLVRGDGEQAVRIAERASGALVYLDREGRVARREPIGPQRPVGLAVTAHGWIVVLGEGTLAKGLRDATLSARAPNERDFVVLVSSLDTPTGLWQRGSWSCLTELPSEHRGEKQVLHCVNPERRLHVVTPPIDGDAMVNDIEAGPTWRVWLSLRRYDVAADDELLSIALP